MKISYQYILLAIFSTIIAVIAIKAVLLYSSVNRYAEFWSKERTRTDLVDPIVYVALGDSAAQGIGASSPQRGYVGILGKRIEKQTQRPVHIINISKSGAKVADVLDSQLTQLEGIKPDIITIDIGGNDIGSFNKDAFEKQAEELFDRLPSTTIISDIPFFGGRGKFDPKQGQNVLAANEILQKLAAEKNIDLVPLYQETKEKNNYPSSYAIDYFHPNDAGYVAWADAFWSKVSR